MSRQAGTLLCAASVLTASVLGCASDHARLRAVDAMSLTAHALEVVDRTSGSEALSEDARAAIDPARTDAHRWLEHAQGALDTWSSDTSTSLAFSTMAPCLGRSLGRLRERLARYDRPIPESLRRAEAVVRTATDTQCARRRRPRSTQGDRSTRPEDEESDDAAP